MGEVVHLTQALESLTCWNENCGIQFAMPWAFAKEARIHGTVFHCPHGHRLRFGDSEIDQLKKQLENEKKRLEWQEQATLRAKERAERAERSAASYKGKLNHVKAHVGNGVCPCCKRSFQNLRKHMETKHPAYKGEE